MVLMIAGGGVALIGATVLLAGSGFKPLGGPKASSSGATVAGGVMLGAGVVVAAVGLYFFLSGTGTKLGPIVATGPESRPPIWADARSEIFAPAPGGTWTFPLGASF